MPSIRSLSVAMGLAVALGSPALAQQHRNAAAPDATTPAPTAAPAPAPAPTGSADLRGTLQQSHGEWRASKLVGATVYNENGQSVGSVDDLLIGQDHKIDQAVVSVGGFLGIGSKLVAVPFDQLKIEHSTTGANRTEAAPPTTATNTAANTPPPAQVAPAGTPPANAPVVGAAPANNNPAPMTTAGTQNPDYFSLVLPGATKDSLTSMTEFRYNG